MSIWQYPELLPAPTSTEPLSLGEGNTPLIASRRVGPKAGLSRLYFKLETSNPSGSYKDRFAASAVTHMLAAGQTLCVATSSGNTGSALAAYCAAAGIECKIAIVETAPKEKLMQMMVHGASLFRVRGFGLDSTITQQTFETLVEFGNSPQAALQISAFKYSPIGMSGVQTISYELSKQLRSVDHVFVPAGGGGLTLAVARGFEQLLKTGRVSYRTRIHCVQPSGNNTIAGPLRAGSDHGQQVACTTTVSGLQVPSVIDGNDVITACRATGGNGCLVEDPKVYETQARLAAEEGIFCEPAGAVAVAGALEAVRLGELQADETAVCLITGSGFKDLNSVNRICEGRECPQVEWDELRNIW